MILRPMTIADLEAARGLWAVTEGVEIAEGDGIDELKVFLDRNPNSSHVAVADGNVVGAVLAGHDGRRGFLYHLAVAADRRGQGIGKELVRCAVGSLKNQKITRILILVARDNDEGFAFWRKQGWEDMAFAAPLGLDT
jgi:ribosomal protein S18 acetylase RimI-like enzyme